MRQVLRRQDLGPGASHQISKSVREVNFSATGAFFAITPPVGPSAEHKIPGIGNVNRSRLRIEQKKSSAAE